MGTEPEPLSLTFARVRQTTMPTVAHTGSCTFGEACKYSHNTNANPAAPAPKAKGKAKGKKPKAQDY